MLMKGGEIFVPKIPSYKIKDIAKAVVYCKIKYTGIRPGEKIHEQMISKSDAQNTIEFKDFYIIYADSDYFKVKNIYIKRKD